MASRYEGMAPSSSPYRGGILRGRELRKIPSQRFRFGTHQIREGDRIDLLAAQYYGDVTLWWRICDANPEVIDWMWLSPGTMLRIPDLTG
jgi:phage tail protein X